MGEIEIVCGLHNIRINKGTVGKRKASRQFFCVQPRICKVNVGLLQCRRKMEMLSYGKANSES